MPVHRLTNDNDNIFGGGGAGDDPIVIVPALCRPIRLPLAGQDRVT